MQLTSYTDYSLRVLIYLAVHKEGLATIAEISQAYGISKAHLTKIVHQLGLAGYLETIRGRGGGLRLARPPEKIRVGEVVRQTEGTSLVECFDPKTSRCRIEPVCGLRAALKDALQTFLTTLDGYTLADVVARRRNPLARLFAAS
ncbi:MAG: Rrf2 family transcriptional regulator [Deltaproteobacteria bacterium]|nr:Rrf2 family transcriptional regulator [Deltaproteobacteria bacterium]